MERINSVELKGRVGSHEIRLRKDGLWEGWLDLHTEGHPGMPACFDCRVKEDNKNVKDLGAGIGGKIVHIRGRLIPWEDTFYVNVTKLDVIEEKEGAK